MPVYEQTYRRYEGRAMRHARWWAIVKQEVRVLSTNRMFLSLVALVSFHFLARILQVVAHDVLTSNPNSPISMVFNRISVLDVNEAMFFNFLRMQAPVVFILSIFAGSGLICNDFQDNLMEVYFSKPMTWRDYVTGKVLTLVLLGLAMTFLPASILVVLHNILAPSMEKLAETWMWPFESLLFSLAIVLPCTLGVLACSALSNGQRIASISVFMLVLSNLVLGGALQGVLRDKSYLILAFPAAINRVGEMLFHSRRIEIPVHWGWALLFVVAVCGVSYLIICRIVRRAEIPA